MPQSHDLTLGLEQLLGFGYYLKAHLEGPGEADIKHLNTRQGDSTMIDTALRRRKGSVTPVSKDEHARWAIDKSEKDRLLELTDSMNARICDAMEKHDISIAWLAKNMGVVDRTISDWRKDGNVSTHRIPLLAHYLNLDPGYLLTGVKEDFQQRSQSAEVVQFERPLNRKGKDVVPTSIITRYIPLYEIDEIATLNESSPHEFIEGLPTWVEQPESRGSTVITLNPQSLKLPGIPRFAVQVQDGRERFHFRFGDFVGFAPDLIPTEGDFCLFAHRLTNQGMVDQDWELSGGYYSVPGGRKFTSKISERFFKTEEFWLKSHPQDSQSSDVHITRCREWAFVGTATHISRWLDEVQLLAQTGYTRRLNSRYEARRNHKLTQDGHGACYNC